MGPLIMFSCLRIINQPRRESKLSTRVQEGVERKPRIARILEVSVHDAAQF